MNSEVQRSPSVAFCGRRAFTLIELLVVVSILMLLASLLLPAFARATAMGKGTVCRSNLRQWGIATLSYAAENNDYLPPDGAPNGESATSGWYVDLPRAAGIEAYDRVSWRTNPAVALPRSVWLCPANRRRSNGVNLFHYCLNENVNGQGAGRRIQSGSIPSPAATIWLFDNGRLAAVGSANHPHTNLHGAGCHFLFVDGHVQRWVARRFWDFGKNQGRLDVPDLKWNPFAP